MPNKHHFRSTCRPSVDNEAKDGARLLRRRPRPYGLIEATILRDGAEQLIPVDMTNLGTVRLRRPSGPGGRLPHWRKQMALPAKGPVTGPGSTPPVHTEDAVTSVHPVDEKLHPSRLVPAALR